MRILFFPFTTPAFNEAALALTPKIYAIQQSLYLDIAPTLSFFKGEQNLLMKAMELASVFLGETPFVLTDRIEWARAFQTEDQVNIAAHQSAKALLKLEIGRIKQVGNPFLIDEKEEAKERKDLVHFMKRVGIRTIGDFAQLSETAVERRFGKRGIALLRFCLGQETLVFSPFVPQGKIQENIITDDIASLETLLAHLKPLLDRIASRLIGRAQLIKTFSLRFSVESKNHFAQSYTLSEPTQKSEFLFKLLSEYLRSLSWDSSLQALEIEITETVPYHPGQLSLFETGETVFFDLSQYLTQLRAKFGDSQVGFAQLKESYLPELSWNTVWPPVKTEQTIFPCGPTSLAHRPLFLFQPAKPCRPSAAWKLIPTENLMAEWWKPHGIRRYFIAIPPTGRRLWLYWDLEEKGWYLHGTFD